MISLIDVVNSLDSKDVPVGHGLKVLKDLPGIFGERVEILARKEYIWTLGKEGTKLPCCVHTGIHKCVALKILCNYFVSLIAAKGDTLIYTITSEQLLWGIALFKGNRKIVVVTYEDWDKYIKSNLVGRSVRSFLVKRGLSRLDGCIVTNSLYKPHIPYVRLPDYYITNEMEEYHKENKKVGCVCLGEMRYGKDVAGLIRVMKKTDIPLLIAGCFQDKGLYQKVKSMQSGNIRIENRNLPYKVYMEYLSTYKYVVLPYDAEYYDGRTSGVLLEGIFLGAVPIAPKNLLRQNGVQGLGYCELSDIPELIFQYERGEILVDNKLEKYQLENYKKKMAQFFNQLDNAQHLE